MNGFNRIGVLLVIYECNSYDKFITVISGNDRKIQEPDIFGL